MSKRPPVPSTHNFFNNAKNPVIHGGQFMAANTINIQNSDAHSESFKLLQKHVAPAAFHDSAQRVDPPRCHENTRLAVLQEIFNWIIQDEMRAAWISWLNGAAGAGKSAICQSIAERCIAHFILVASFFFFRTDRSRCTIDPLVATLAYQLILLIPDAKDLICNTIERNPLIFRQSFETQLRELIIQPLRQLQLTRTTLKLLLIIDGVDECSGYENQMNIIRTLTKFVAVENSPIIVLFGSRAENQLQSVFRSRAVAGTLLQFPLDNNYLPDNDIRHFLTDKFAEIKETHPFGHLLSAEWPMPKHVEEIVAKSSGQFIYASVVINFISLPHAYPSAQLDIIHGLRPLGLATPFSQLDALYRHIFSTVRDLQTTTALLAFIILTHELKTMSIEKFFNLPAEEVLSAFSDLAAVVAWNEGVDWPGEELQFLHASLPDFLLDKGRSKEYHINTAIWSTHLAIRSFQALQDPQAHAVFWETIHIVLKTAEGTPNLQASMMTFDPSIVSSALCRRYDNYSDYLTLVKGIKFDNGDKVYHYQLYMVTRYFVENKPQWVKRLSKRHDISQIRAKIALERMVPSKVFKWFKRGSEKLFR